MNSESAIRNPQSVIRPILLFDGVCNLCNGWVDFVIRHDRKGQFQFAALQSETGQKLLAAAGFSAEKLDSVVLIDGPLVFQKSDVPFEIARRLGSGWRLFLVFRWLPLAFRNRVYDWVAANRYRWFGQRETCRLPTAAERGRFL